MLTELLAALVIAFIDLIVHLLAFAFSSTYLAKHNTGLKRSFYLITALSALHLVSALVLPIMTGTDTFLLSPLFSWPAMLVALVLLLTSIAAIIAMDITHAGPTDAPSGTKVAVSMGLSYGLALIVLFGGAAIWSAQHERKTLRDELCQSVTGKISETWKDQTDGLLSLSDRYLGKDARRMSPCQPQPK